MEFIIKELQSDSLESKKLESHRLFEELLSQKLGKPVKYSDIPRSQTGKPLPIDGVHFSISHSGRFLAIATSDKPIGIDIIDLEKYQNKAFSEQFLEKILAHDEQPISGNPIFNFSAKEAYLKKSGAGIAGRLSSLNANLLIATGQVFNHSTATMALFIAE